MNETDSEDTDLQIFCVSCSHPVNPKVALRHMERCYAKVNICCCFFWAQLLVTDLWSHWTLKIELCYTNAWFIILTVWKPDLFRFHFPNQNRRVREIYLKLLWSSTAICLNVPEYLRENYFIYIYIISFYSIRATRLFCDVYNPQSKTYCKRLQVLCPEHSRDPKVRVLPEFCLD